MRICLVSHGFPPVDRTGVEQYTEALAGALSRAGHRVEVFAPRRTHLCPEASVRREQRDGFGVNWLTTNAEPAGPKEMLESPHAAKSFGRFLDREKPELIHFQHVIKLGIGIIHEAEKRGIPTVYTAHDYYAVCHRYTLLKPDLSHCDVRGDSMACALCDCALGYLNGIGTLGDYQMGASPEQLDEGQRAALDAILDDEAEEAGLAQEDFDAAFDQRRELDSMRAEAFSKLDLVVAPTQFLAEELVRGGIERERIEVLPYGIENADLVDLPPIQTDSPVRFAYLGGLSKHKGVQHLIAAFKQAALPAELSVWGYSTDEPHVRRLKSDAEGAGVVWRGSYEREDLPACLAEADVIVVPSIWVENYPIVIREALSARRPVIAYRFGALSESVRDGVDGLLVEPVGDADALADAMRRCVEEDGLLARLAAGIEPVKGIDEQAQELLPKYEALLAKKREAPSGDGEDLPVSLEPFVSRYERLDALSNRELFATALQGLERLRRGLGGDIAKSSVDEVLVDAFRPGSRAQHLLRDANLEGDWLHTAVDAIDAERKWLRGLIDAKEKELGWLRSQIAGVERSRAELEQARDQFEEALVESRAGSQRLEDDLKVKEEDLHTFVQQLRSTAELGMTAIRAQELLLRTELTPLIERLSLSAGSDPEMVREESSGLGLVEAARKGRKEANQLLHELEWRRGQMRGVTKRIDKRIFRIFLKRVGFGRQLLSWTNPPKAEGGDE